MPFYDCIVSNSSGKTQHVKYSAFDENEVIKHFRESGEFLLEIKQTTTPVSNLKLARKKRERLILDFTGMMELLLDSGLSLKDSLEMISAIQGKDTIGSLAQFMLESIKKGKTFASVINSMTSVFPPVYRGLVTIGDRIGSIEKIFSRLRVYLENKNTLYEKLINALVYPLMILITTLFGGTALLIFVIPRIQSLFSSFGGEAASAIEHNLNSLQTGLTVVSLLFFIILISSAVYRMLSKKYYTLRLSLDRFLLSVPGIGYFLKAWQTLNFSYSMETLLQSSIPLENALQESVAVVTNTYYTHSIIEVKNAIIKGDALSQAFQRYNAFPQYMIQWLVIGEKTGKSDKVFLQIRNYFQKEIEKFSERYMALIEPALIAIVGIFLLLIIISIVLPFLTMYTSFLTI